MKRYLLVTMLMVLAVIMLLSGCTKSSTTTPTTPATSPTTTATTPTVTTPTTTAPKTGGTWRILISSLAPEALGNPWEIKKEYYLVRPLYDPVLNFDSKGNIIPWLATEWKYSPDSLTLTLTLKQGVTFQDGTTFDAAALKWNMDQYVTAKRSEWASVSSIEAPNSNTVVVKFTKPDSAFLFHLALSCFSTSPTAYGKNGGKDENRWKPMGTGPFMLVSYEATIKTIFSKNDGYWQKGKPYLSGIEMTCIADSTVAIASFLGGEADTLTDTQGNIFPDKLTSKEGQYYMTKAPDSVITLVSDSAHADSPFADIRVRQAMCYALDVKSIADALGKGFWVITNQLSDPKSMNYNSDVVGYPYNVQKAKDLLALAGYTNGLDITFPISQGFLPIATAIQAQLGDAGIRATFNVMQTPQFVSMIMGQGWNNGISTCPINVQLITDLIGTLRQNYTKQGNWFTTTILRVDEIESKINQAGIEVDLQKRALIIHDLQKMIIDKYCLALPLFEMVQKCYSYNPVKDSNYFSPVGSWWWNPENTWLNK
jgi:peptide/nickel transport system substrate-binding protein